MLRGRVSIRRHKHRPGWAVRIWGPRWFMDIAWYRHEPRPTPIEKYTERMLKL